MLVWTAASRNGLHGFAILERAAPVGLTGINICGRINRLPSELAIRLTISSGERQTSIKHAYWSIARNPERRCGVRVEFTSGMPKRLGGNVLSDTPRSLKLASL